MKPPWRVERALGPAQALLDESARRISEGEPARTVRVLEVRDPAVVLGGSQRESDLDTDRVGAEGVEIARRRSGGGAVLLRPDSVVWVDVVLPASDELWVEDVIKAPLWLGELWARALERLGFESPSVWGHRARSTSWSSRVCFGGIGPGEVLAGSRKVVGLSQRRTRRGALFQTAALLKWEPAELLKFVRPRPGDQLSELENFAAGIGEGRGSELLDALLDMLMQ